MAKRGLGGSDFSSTFSSLYSFNKDQAKAQQQADDADAQDKWANGLMSDDEWLAYIRTAIDREAADPKSQEKWITALRKYSSAIADKQAEHNFENGGSINQLVAYYQKKLSTMVKDSNEYRDVESRLNDLLDKRSGDTLTSQAKTMMDQINAGKKTYGDLKALLVAGLHDARDNSGLKKSIQEQIDQVNETLRTNKVEGRFEQLQYQYDAGKLSGRAYAAQLRALAAPFKANDPKRYYQILEAAVQLDKNAARRGHGRGGSTKAINKSIDAIQAKRVNIEAQINQYESGAVKGIDPATGQVVVFSPGKIKELDHAYLAVEDQLTAAYTKKGDLSAAATAQKYKAQYIATTIVKHNSVAADDQRRELMASTSKLLDHALSNPDPTSAMATVRFVAKQWGDFSKSLTQKKTTSPAYAGDKNRHLPAEGAETQYHGAKGMLDQVDSDLISASAQFAAALQTLATPGIDDASASAALDSLYAITGRTATNGDPAKNPFVALGTRALEVNSREQGIASGELVRVAGPSGLVWARTQDVGQDIPDPNGGSSMVHVTTKVPAAYRDPSGTWRDLNVDNKKTKLVDVYVDINGTPTKMSAIATLTTPQGFDAWVASKTDKGKGLVAGAPLTVDQLKKLGGAAKLAQLGLIEQQPAFQAWSVQLPGSTDAHGNSTTGETWTQDPRTGMWYKGALPVRGVLRNDDGTVQFTQDGAQIDWKAYGDASGAPAPYAGSNGKAMQDIVNSGGMKDIVSKLRSTDGLGNVTDQGPNLDHAYFGHEAESPLLTGSWWNDETQAEKAQQKAKQQAEFLQTPNQKDAQKLAGANMIADMVTGTVGTLAKAFGINLEGTKPHGTFSGSDQTKSDNDRNEIAILQKKAKSPSTGPLVVLPKSNIASGPAVTAKVGDLGLKPAAVSYPKIRNPDVVPPKAPAKTPAKAPAKSSAPKVTPPKSVPLSTKNNKMQAS